MYYVTVLLCQKCHHLFHYLLSNNFVCSLENQKTAKLVLCALVKWGPLSGKSVQDIHLGKSVAARGLRLVVVYVNISEATFKFLRTNLMRGMLNRCKYYNPSSLMLKIRKCLMTRNRTSLLNSCLSTNLCSKSLKWEGKRFVFVRLVKCALCISRSVFPSLFDIC